MRAQQRNQQPAPALVSIELHVPEELLAWAETPEVEVTLRRPFARDVRALLAKGELERPDTARLFARLDGLVTAALAANRGDLLLGFDTLSADWLGLRYSTDTALGRLEVGRDAAWTFNELNIVFAAGREAAIFAWQAKALCADVFPGSRISAIASGESPTCTSCGQGDFSVMMQTDGGAYCRKCWQSMITRPKTLAELDEQDAQARKQRR